MESFRYVYVLILVVKSIGWGNGTTTSTGTNVNNTTADNLVCKLIPRGLEIREEIANLANGEYQLVKLKVQIEGTNLSTKNIYSTSVYHPREWMIPTSLTGKSLLMLREYFEPMSLYTLAMGVAKLDVVLEQHPAHCLDSISAERIETLLRDSILNNFGSDSTLPESAEVCNQHVMTGGTRLTRLLYICCKKDLNQAGVFECRENSETIWIKLLFVTLFIGQGILVAFCPLLLPATFFKAKTVFQNFVYKTEPEKSLVLNVKVVDSDTNVGDTFVETKRHAFTHLHGFIDRLQKLTIGKIYTMHVTEVDMSILEDKIVADGSAPIGLLSFIYCFFVRCGLRKDLTSVSACCSARMCQCGPACEKINIRWYQCLRVFMLLPTLAFFTLPWILRVCFYYIHEYDTLQYKENLYKTLGVTIPFDGFVVTYLSPIHPLFIAIYILLGLEMLFYLPQTDAVKRRLKFTIRKCFRDMRDSSRVEACGYFISKMLYPLTRFGILGCLAFPLWVLFMPFLLLLLVLEVIPLANLTLRLLSNLIYYTLRLISPQTFNFVSKFEEGRGKRWINNRLESVLVTDFQEENTRINQFVHVLSLIMTLVSIWFVLFLVADCIIFFVECIVYMLVGFILNPWFAWKYVSFILLIVVYGIDCFHGVNEKYVAYGQAINTKLQSMVGDRLKDVASQNAKDQVNSAFRIESTEKKETMYLVAGSERYLKWRAPRLVLFLDNSDIPFIPKSFLMQMGKLQHPICPGQVYILYLKAFLDFAMILLFLFFVFIVIFAFGQAQDISTTGQTIAALGSGFVPLILKKFLFQTQSGPTIDTDNMKFHYMFLNAVENYRDRWNFEDLHVESVEEAILEDYVETTTCAEHDEDKLAHESTTEEVTDGVNERPVPEPDNDDSSTVGIINDNAIELLPVDNKQKIEIDLIVKEKQSGEKCDDFEFYVPATRAADCEDVILTIYGIHPTVV